MLTVVSGVAGEAAAGLGLLPKVSSRPRPLLPLRADSARLKPSTWNLSAWLSRPSSGGLRTSEKLDWGCGDASGGRWVVVVKWGV